MHALPRVLGTLGLELNDSEVRQGLLSHPPTESLARCYASVARHSPVTDRRAIANTVCTLCGRCAAVRLALRSARSAPSVGPAGARPWAATAAKSFLPFFRVSRGAHCLAGPGPARLRTDRLQALLGV